MCLPLLVPDSGTHHFMNVFRQFTYALMRTLLIVVM
jgi:hypothetical protein